MPFYKMTYPYGRLFHTVGKVASEQVIESADNPDPHFFVEVDAEGNLVAPAPAAAPAPPAAPAAPDAPAAPAPAAPLIDTAPVPPAVTKEG